MSAATTGERSFPPIAWLTTSALALVIIGGILVASYAPRHAPLGVVGALLGVALAVMVVAVVLLTRLREFAWSTFVTVFKWTLLAYVIEAGVIEFAFVHGHTRGATLALVTGMLVIFGVSVPTTVAFTTARYADASN